MNLTDILAAIADITDPDERVARIDELLASEDVDLAALEQELSNRAADLTSIDPAEMTEDQIVEAETVAQLLVMVDERIEQMAASAASDTAEPEPAADTSTPPPAAPELEKPGSDTQNPDAHQDPTPEEKPADTTAPAPASAPEETLPETQAQEEEPAPAPDPSPTDTQTNEQTPETPDNSRAEAALKALDNANNNTNHDKERTLDPVTASGTASTTGRVPLNRINPGDTNTATSRERDQISYSVLASGDLPGHQASQGLDTLTSITAAVNQGMAAVARSQAPGIEQGLVVIKRDAPDHLTYKQESDWQKVDAVTQQRNLPGGSLVAAGGWCAPSEYLYDTCPITVSSDGMIDLPTITTSRGGIKYSGRPDFSNFWASSFIMSEQDAMAGLKKPCVEIPCPADLSECRMDVAGICLKQPLLAERGWPEKQEEFVEYTMLAHAHYMNAERIRRMVDLATHVIEFDAPAEPQDGAVFDPHGPGAFESVLSILELQVEYFRYSQRLARNALIEGMAPYWLRGLLRADISKKLGIDNRWGAAADAALDEWFADRGVRIQYVYDWQESLSDGDPTSFGGSTPPTEWPNQVDILLWEPGTYFALQQDVITLSGIYDSVDLQRNMYTRLFTEEGFQVCTRCGRSMLLRLNLCPNGLSGSHQKTTCNILQEVPADDDELVNA